MNLPAYPEYADSSIATLGRVPKSWTICKFGRLLSQMFSGTSIEQVPDSPESVMVTRIETISNGKFDFDKTGFIPRSTAPTSHRLKLHDIQLSNINSLSMIGNCAQLNSGREIYAGMNLLTLRAGQSVDSRYLFWLLVEDRFRHEMRQRAKPAINQASLTQSALSSIMVARPSLVEQKAISTFLDRETAQIDALIDKQEQLIATLREDREAVIAHSVMKSLNKNVSLSFVAPLRTSIPKHWKVMPLRRIGNLVTGGTPPTTEDGHFSSSNEGIPWLRPDDIDESGRPSIASKCLSASGETLVPILPANSVHVVSIGSIGKVGYVDTVSSSNQQITAITNAASPKFLYFAIAALKDQLWASSMGTTLSILSAGRLGSVKVPYPPLEEQQAISAFLDLQCQKVDKLIDRSQVMIEVLREYRSALITNAVTGKIDVREAM